jgi:hypothetical protein
VGAGVPRQAVGEAPERPGGQWCARGWRCHDHDKHRQYRHQQLPGAAVSLARMFNDRVAATPRAKAFRLPAETGWATLTWTQIAETVKTPLRTRWPPQQSPWRADRADGEGG